MLERHFNTPELQSFHYPGRLLAGPGARLRIADLLPAGPRVVVVDERFAKDPFVASLGAAHTITVSGEPKEGPVLKAAAGLPKATAAVIAIGGGSTIDTAKALTAIIARGTHNIRDETTPRLAPVLVAVPTTAAAGSETSRFFILADDHSGEKRSYRSWSFTPDLAVLDPVFLEDTAPDRLVLGAFDAFMHLWETFVCRGERSVFTDTLALDGIPRILEAMTALLSRRELDDAQRANLQYAASLGGIAISNVRTGLVHTLGESLSAQSALPHPATLYVFFDAAVSSYAQEVSERMALLRGALDGRLANGGTWTLLRLVETWHLAFESFGLRKSIADAIAAAPVDIERLLATAARDTVLAKENPRPLADGDLRLIAGQALRSLGPRKASLHIPRSLAQKEQLQWN